MMLNISLCRMIDKTECIFLFNTPNAIPCSKVVMTEIVRRGHCWSIEMERVYF